MTMSRLGALLEKFVSLEEKAGERNDRFNEYYRARDRFLDERRAIEEKSRLDKTVYLVPPTPRLAIWQRYFDLYVASGASPTVAAHTAEEAVRLLEKARFKILGGAGVEAT